MADRYLQPASAQDLRLYGGYYFNPSPDNCSDRSMIENDNHAHPQDLSMRRVKSLKDKMSHRMIEKRRRDRMNTCLEELCRLLPANYIKQGQGRIEKTEIIESAIRYIHQLQRVKTEGTDMEILHRSCCQQNYEMGFNECSRYVTTVLSESDTSADTNCLLSYLKTRGRGNEHSKQSPEVDRSSSPNKEHDDITDDNCHSPNADVYKFKKDIRQRFVEDQMDGSQNTESESLSTSVPGFVLDSNGRSYIPMTIDIPSDVSLRSPQTKVSHPVNIQVKFVEPIHLHTTQ